MYNAPSNFRVLSSAVRKSAARNTRKKDCIVRSVPRFKHSFFFLFFLMLGASVSQAQSLELSMGFNRLDYQLGVGYGHRVNDFYFSPKLEMGLNSSFASGRFFPRISLGSTYFLLTSKRFELGPELTYAYSRQRLTFNGKTAHHWNELNLGYRLQFGNRVKLVHSASGGWLNELFYSEVAGRIVNFHSIGYYAQIGISYTW